MPHSLSLSQASHHTFDLGIGEVSGEESRPMSAGGESARTKRASSSYGVALTSTVSQDERAGLPSQQRPDSWKRKSAPGSEFAELLASTSTTNFDELLRLHRPGDRSSVHSTSYNDTSKRRSQYFEDSFLYKDGAMTQAKEKVVRQSPVIAELKTNVIIKDEFTLVTDLTMHLAQRYTRPESCIMIRVDHSACLALGGNFEPCYMLTIHAVPAQMGPTTNKRNASIIQTFMQSVLSVTADRGIVTFAAMAEENVAMNGHTMLGEIERQEKRNSVNDPAQLKSAIKDATRRSMTFPQSQSDPKLNGNHKNNGTLTPATTISPSITPPPTLLREKASSSDKDGRPSTAHGGFDGLRMNGVSTDMLVGSNARLPNSRPKTFDGGAPSSSIQDSLKSQPLPHLVSQQSQRSSIQHASLSKPLPNPNGPKATAVQPSTKPALTSRPSITPRTKSSPSGGSNPTAARPATAIPRPETRPKNTYLDGISNLTKKTPSSAPRTDDDDDLPLAKIAAGKANTAAKRRSTITATPEFPKSATKEKERARTKGPLKPPPVPDETRSMSSRLAKRKSFMRMFKRQSVPAWYEQ